MEQAANLYKITQGLSVRVRVCIQLESRVHALNHCAAAIKEKGKANRIHQSTCSAFQVADY